MASMQSDGNFVLYDLSNQAKWSTGTSGNLVMQNDGNLIVYTQTAQARWALGSFTPCS
jgi:hypothetical protein